VRPEEALPVGKEFMRRFMGVGPRLDGIAGAPFVIYHGEVSADSDGPIEWCWPVPEDQAAEVAAKHPDLTLRTEPAHQEVYVHQGMAAQVSGPQAAVAIESLVAWTAQNQRQLTGAPRQIFLSNPANGGAGPDCDFAIPLR